jgi:hypothetical protein
MGARRAPGIVATPLEYAMCGRALQSATSDGGRAESRLRTSHKAM